MFWHVVGFDIIIGFTGGVVMVYYGGMIPWQISSVLALF